MGRLRRVNIGCLLTLGTLHYVKDDFLTFLERLEAAHADLGIVCEQIRAAIVGCDKTEALCVVKPFNCTGCHVVVSFRSEKYEISRINVRVRNCTRKGLKWSLTIEATLTRSGRAIFSMRENAAAPVRATVFLLEAENCRCATVLANIDF